MNYHGKAWLLLRGVLLIIALWVISCSDGELEIGDRFIDSETYSSVIDTFSLQLSTMKVDSVITSATGVALLGKATDIESGEITSDAFFKIAKTGDTFNTDEVFDSLTLVMKHSGYHYGDTAALFSFKVFLLSEEPEFEDNGKLYNTSRAKYNPDPIGVRTYIPEPNNVDETEVEIRLSDELGQLLTDTLKEGSGLTPSDFDDWIPGIALIPDTVNNRAVIGYKASADSIYLRLYTHLTLIEEKEIYHDFPLISPDYQFNRIKGDPGTSALLKLDSYKKLLPEQEFQYTALQQGGVGYFTRVDFPGVNTMQTLREEGHIVKAYLILEVKEDTYPYKDPPPLLSLLEVDRVNQFKGYLSDGNGQSVVAHLESTGKMYEYEARYTFDITHFLNGMVEADVIPDGTGVAVALPEESLSGTVDRVVFSGYGLPGTETKLKVFYYYYDKE